MTFLAISTNSGLKGGSFQFNLRAGTVRRSAGWWVLALLLGASGLAPYAWAADGDESAGKQSPIVVNLKQFKVVSDAKGETKLVDASLVVPGDTLEYQAVYTNRSNGALAVTATLPVPEAMEYLKDTAKSKPRLPYTVAQKDSQYAQEPLFKQVTSATGAAVMQAVPYAAYRFVRWDLGKLMPGVPVEVSIRAKVAQDPQGDVAAGK